ncbi:MAG: hypothetical protein EBX52_02775 [Proteobacteria bacterium]|nr:hypothetical protein [Pseudomonadota bacterium]
MAANSKTYKKSTCQEHVLTTPGCADAIERNQFLENLEREGKSRYALAQKALKECVDRLKAESGKNLKVTGVEIESSASRFRNTGIACQKTFSDLSADRANSAKSLLLGIFYDENISTTGLPVNIDSIGEWGHKIDLMKAAGAKVDKEIEKLRGTSGPKPDPDNRPEFDQYKYVKIRIHYKTITPIVPLVDEQNKYTVICRGLDLASCSEDDKPNEGNGKFHVSRGYKHSGSDGSHKVHRKRTGSRKHARCDAYP